MDSTPIPELSENDAAVAEPASQPSGAATEAPEKKVQEESVPLATGDELIGVAPYRSLTSPALTKFVYPPPPLPPPPRLSSPPPLWSPPPLPKINDCIGLLGKRRHTAVEDVYRLIKSVEEDPDESWAAEEAQDPNWRWPSYDEVFDQLGSTRYAKRGKALNETITGSPFQVIYRNAREVVLWPDTVKIKLKSPHLMAILSEYFPEDKDLQYLKKLDLDGRRVYTILDKLKEHKFRDDDENSPNNISAGLQLSESGVSNGVRPIVNLNTDISELDSSDVKPEAGRNLGVGSSTEEARLHLHHLVRFIDEEYKVVAQKHKHMKEDKCVSFDMVWAFLTPGTTVVYQCNYTQEQLCGKVTGNSYFATDRGKIFSVTLAVWDYNGAAYRECIIARAIRAFSGEKPFDTLEVRPIDLDRTTPADVLEAEFMAKGRRFKMLAMENANCFMHYKGPTFQVRQGEIVKEKADGRVMIDLRNFAVMKPNFPMHTAQPPVSTGTHEIDSNLPSTFSRDEIESKFSNFRSGYSNSRGRFMARHMSVQRGERARMGPALVETLPMTEIDERNLIFAPAIVFGFSFVLKRWGVFAVTGFSEIVFDTNAFDALVMEPEHKGLLYSLVSQFIASPTTSSGPSVNDMPRVDPIANKGEGCIFLCYGPPGTGKTLTAESLAENLRRPLWALSVAELGTTPGDLEKVLLRTLEIAAMWKAVLLLDEADVYLEKRVAAGDLTRNAMTGVFMRLLEYYRGVLFLTTNRITTFDDAFRSRISLVLCYPKLNKGRRLQIWTAALARVQAGKGEEVKVSSDFLVEVARKKMNGREIRNAIHTAQTLARSKSEDLQEEHLRFVMRVITKTSDILDANLQGT